MCECFRKYAGLYEEDRNTNFFVTTDIDEAIFLADRLLIMTNLPTSTRSVIEIDIPRPRNIDVRVLQHQKVKSK